MSMGGGKETTMSQERAYLPGFVKAPLQRQIGRVEDLATQAYTPFEGDRVAGFGPDEERAFELTRGLVGQTQLQPSMDISQEVARRGLEGFSQAELQPYMDPYIQNVLDVARGRQFDEFSRQQNLLGDQAAQAGAFGGSRFGLQEAQLSEDFQRQISEFDVQGLSGAFQQGLSGAMQGTQLAGQAGMDLAKLQQAQQQAGLTDIGALQGVGAQQRGLAQQGLDVGYGDYLTEQAFPYEQEQFLAGILNPAASLVRGRDSTTETETEQSGLGQALGLAATIAAPFTGGMSLAGMAGGLASSIGGMGAITGMAGMGASNAMLQGGINQFVGGMNQNQGFMPSLAGQPQIRLERGGVVQGYQRGGEVMSPNDLTREEWLQVQDSIGRGETAPASGELIDERYPVFGAPKDYFDVLLDLESGGDPNAVSSAGAKGLFQFKDVTAKRYNLKDPFDPVENRRAAGEMTTDNAISLQKSLKREPSLPEVYLAHQQGPTGAAKLLKNPDKLAVDVVPRSHILGNKGTKNMTAGEFVDMWEKRYLEKAGGPIQPTRKPQEYQRGGPVTPFQRDVRGFIDPITRGASDLTQHLGLGSLSAAGGLSGIGDYFTRAEGDPSKRTQVLEAMRAEQQLGRAEDRLQRGITPAGLEHMMGQVGPLARAGVTDVRLGAGGRGLDVYASTPQEQGLVAKESEIDALTRTLDQAEKVTGVRPTPQVPQETKKEEGGINLPLLNLGAAMLQSKGNFFQSLGAGAEAFSRTKMGQQKMAQEQELAVAKAKREDLRAELYGKQVEAQMAKVTNPMTKQLERLKIAKLQREVSGEGNLQKRMDKVATTLLETGQAKDLEDAYAQARSVVMTEGVLNNQQQQGVPDPLGLLR